MADSKLRNRKPRVEDASDSEGDTFQNHVQDKVDEEEKKVETEQEASTSNKGVKENPKGESIPQVSTRVAARNHSRYRSFFISFLVATAGVLLKSLLDKVYPPNRYMQIEQSIGGVQGNCWKIANIHGPEDIEIFSHAGLAFVSSDDRSWQTVSSYFHRPSSKTVRDGGIFTLKLDDKKGSPRECRLKAFTSADFHPGGMSLFTSTDPDTNRVSSRLFVINHSHVADAVEVFDYDIVDNSLFHVRSIVSSEFVTPKDIVAVGNNQFYLTNHHGLQYKIGRVVEEVVGMSLGSVVYYNGSVAIPVLKDMRKPQGIALSPDGSQLYVSSFANKQVHVYNRTSNLAESELVEDESIYIGASIENISVDKDTGDIYIAGHPSYSAYVRYQMGYESTAPSHVVKAEKLEPENYISRMSEAPDLYFYPRRELPPLKFEIKDLFYSSGEDIAASSVAAYWKNDLILGSPIGNHLLRCTLAINSEDVKPHAPIE